jgi:hypothetical protein
MKKLVWSAFAMSLCLISVTAWSQTESIDDFLGLESEILPGLKGHQRFSPRDLHEKAEWNVQEAAVEVDTEPLKGQKYSLIPWETQDPEAWLSVEKWLIERSLKDKNPDWKLRLRDDRQFEHVGKVLQCRGKCGIFRGSERATAQHLSRINEGDEFKTESDSVAWIYLMDGTLVRIGPSSSVSFTEINWSKTEVFHLVRLHQGHLYWHPRDSKEFPLELSPETDALSLPILVREANLGWFERNIFQKQSDFARSEETMKLEDTAITAQIAKLNELRVQNNLTAPPVTRVMVVAPNGSLVGKLTSFDIFHYPGGKSHFKKRLPLEGHELSLHLRGYTETETTSITEETWYEIDVNGRSHSKVEQVTGGLEITELLTRRIKTLELAREFWLEKYTVPVVKTLETPKELAIKHGYSLWGEELNRRFDFLAEYTRRMETTNLKSMDNLLKKLEANGETLQKEMNDEHYQATLNYYLKDLKTRYTNKRMQVREMSDLQYYIWILRHGKKQN